MLKDMENITYSTIKQEGFSVFPPTAKNCLALMGEGDESDNTHYAIALGDDSGNNQNAIILHTAKTLETAQQKIQNLHTILEETYSFVNVRRIPVGKRVIDSFLKDATEFKDYKVSLEDETGATRNNSEYSGTLKKFCEIIGDAIDRDASDIHYEVNPTSARYVFRIDGKLSYEQGMNVGEAREMMSSALQTSANGFTGFEDDLKKIDVPISLNVEVKDGDTKVLESVRLRLNRRGKAGHGYKGTMRIIRTKRKHMDLASLKYPDEQAVQLKGILNAPYGIFLSTGPVGSGKSTLNTALIEGVSPEKGGLSLEDPVEYQIHHKNIHQYQVSSSEELKEYLKASLRQDPNIIGVSEIRDEEVAKLTFEYSRVGTVMISTLHTNDAIGAYERLIDLGISHNELLSPDTFLGIMNQRLIRYVCPDCNEKRDVKGVGLMSFRNPEGCVTCKKTGNIKGRLAISELLIPSILDAPFIKNEDWYGWREDLIKRGFITLALRAHDLCSKGIICYRDCQESIPHMNSLAQHLNLSKMGFTKDAA